MRIYSPLLPQDETRTSPSVSTSVDGMIIGSATVHSGTIVQSDSNLTIS